MTKDYFKSLFTMWDKFIQTTDALDTLNISIIDSVLFDIPAKLFDDLVSCYVKEEYMDFIYDFIYSVSLNNGYLKQRQEEPLEVFDSNTEELIASIATLDDLYNYLNNNNAFYSNNCNR